MATMVRSLEPQLMPVKYFKVVPQSNIKASILFLASRLCAFATLASLSFTVIGNTSKVMDLRSCGNLFSAVG